MDLFGPSESEKLWAKRTEFDIRAAQAVHQAEPGIPSPLDLPTPEPKSDLLSDITFGLLGEDNSSIVKAHAATVSKLRQANEQGKLSPKELEIRIATLTSEFSAKDPENASVYQALGTRVLGGNPQQSLLAQGREAEALKTAQQDTLNATYLKAFAESGTLPPLNDKGELDIPLVYLKGAQFLNNEYLLKQAKVKSESFTHADKVDAQTIAARQFYMPAISTALQNGVQHLKVWERANPGINEIEKQKFILQSVSDIQSGMELSLRKKFANSNMIPEAIDKTLKEFNDYFDTLIKPNIKDFKIVSELAKTLEDKGKIDFAVSHPQLNELTRLFGVEGAQLFTQTLVLRNAELNAEIEGGVLGEIKSTLPGARQPSSGLGRINKPDLLKSLINGKEVMSGERKFSEMTKAELYHTLKPLVEGLKSMADNPEKLDTSQIYNWGTTMAQSVLLARQYTDKDNLLAASKQLASPKMVSMLQRSQTVDPEGTQMLGAELHQLTTAAIVRYSDALKPMSVSDKFGVTEFSYAFNPSNNKFEVVASNKESRSIPGYVSSAVENLNFLLNSSISTKDFGSSNHSRLSPAQLSQALADVGGFSITEGMTRTKYDSSLIQGSGVSSSPKIHAESTEAEIKTAVTQASLQEGVDPALGLSLIHVESKFKPLAKSKTGAVGLSQLTRVTAEEMGVNRENISDNLVGGIKYLAKLIGRWGDERTALKHYGDPKELDYADKVLAVRDNYLKTGELVLPTNWNK